MGAPRENSETTHYSVVDGEGNAVAVTYTINGYFGAGVVAPGTGFFLNNEMDDFTVKPGAPNLYGLVQGEPNAIAPGKRPLSSMTPTLVEQDGRVVPALGSPGGSRIITTVLETIMNLVDHGMTAQAGGRRAAPPPPIAAGRRLFRALRPFSRGRRSAHRDGVQARRAAPVGRGRIDRDRQRPASRRQ